MAKAKPKAMMGPHLPYSGRANKMWWQGLECGNLWRFRKSPMDYPYNDIQEGFLISVSWGGYLSLRSVLQNIAEEGDTLRVLERT